MYANGLSRRIARLEEANRPPCEVCGEDPRDAIGAYEVAWSEGPTSILQVVDLDPDDDPDDRCEGCGRPLVIEVNWNFVDGVDA